MAPLSSYLSMLISVAVGVLYIGGSVAAIALSLVWWRRTRRPFFAGAAWFFGLSFVGPLAAGLAVSLLLPVLMLLFEDQQMMVSISNLFMLLLSTILPAAGLVLLLRGARAESDSATDGGGEA